jgi:hypothetical protein
VLELKAVVQAIKQCHSMVVTAAKHLLSKWGGAKHQSYIHGIKLISMNKKEIRNAINKAAYQFAESLGYDMSDDNDGSSVTFKKPGCQRADDTIEWHRSYQYTCVVNWASDEIKADADAIDAHMKPIIEHYNSMYVAK